MSIQDTVRRFVVDNFYVGSGTLDDDVSLLDQGVVDSTGVLEVIAFLEETFDIEVDDAESTPDNLDTIERIAAFVARKQRGVGGAAA